MMGHMEKAGCPVDPKEFFVVRHCAENVGGGFDAEASKQGGIVLCQNHIRDYEHAELTLTHELIHSFDHCRAYVDWSNCVHHACSEVRAANLSGDCSMFQEFNRGHMNFKGQGQECVRRRATLSVSMNPSCSAPGRHHARFLEEIAISQFPLKAVGFKSQSHIL
ncbi:peptidase M76 [Baffinella frigidus]|nr:peptidase M76 [Cryptophyta sp. CCMP2293]